MNEYINKMKYILIISIITLIKIISDETGASIKKTESKRFLGIFQDFMSRVRLLKTQIYISIGL